MAREHLSSRENSYKKYPTMNELVLGEKKLNVSVIIPARNESNYINKCLAAIAEQDYEWGYIEVLVSDGNSTDNTRDLINKFIAEKSNDLLKVSILNNTKRTAACGMNLGFKNASGDFLMPFSAHAYMDKSFVRKNIECLISTNADVCGGIVKSAPDSKSFLARAIGKALNTKFALGGITARTGKKVQPMENPSFGMYRREVFDDFGYLDENLIRNSDYEFNLRLKNNGVKIMFSPEIVSYYYNRPSIRRLYLQYYYTSFYKAYMIGKYPQIIKTRHLVPTMFFLSLIILFIMSIPFPIFWLPLFGLLGIYALASLAFSITNFRYFLILPLIFLTIHLGYGMGFMFGYFVFKILRMEPKTPVNQENPDNISSNA